MKVVFIPDADDKDNEEVQIVSSGAINKQIAEHIVKVHNQSLESK